MRLPERILTVKQPWADLIMAGVKTVENRTWPVPSTLPQWTRCTDCGYRQDPWCARDWCDNFHVGVPDGPFPFTIGIHAAVAVDYHDNIEGWRALGRAWGTPPIGTNFRASERAGCLLGTVTVTGCHHADECGGWAVGRPGASGYGAMEHWGLCSPWAKDDHYHWIFTDPQPLPEPIPMKGRLGLWRPRDAEVLS